MTARGVFITGTDTGVGKTIVTAGITYCLRSAGIDAVPMKPVQTGASIVDGELVSPDLRFCLATCSLSPSPEEERRMSPYCFETACSPHLAARMAGEAIELDRVVERFSSLSRSHEAVVVEGAGGVLAPVNISETMLDLMNAVSLPVILVARSGLGTINHTMLTLKALEEAALEVLGVIFNDGLDCPSEFIAADNIRTVCELAGTVSLGRLDRLPGELTEAIRERFPHAFSEWGLVMRRTRST
jgi:dethiobiotin synthetase